VSTARRHDPTASLILNFNINFSSGISRYVPGWSYLHPTPETSKRELLKWPGVLYI